MKKHFLPAILWRLGCVSLLLIGFLFPNGPGLAIEAPEPTPPAPALAQVRTSFPTSLTPDPLIQEMVSQVISDTLYHYVGDLSGAWPVTIGGSSYLIATRSTLTDIPIQEATQFAYEHFQSFGLQTSYDVYPVGGKPKRNVIAEQIGLIQPARIFLLTAHLDSTTLTSPSTLAPGADDNGSGSAAVMRIADILSQYPFGCTLRYALFTGEEQGLYGSKAYAREVKARGDAIEAVINLDMLGYNTPGTAPTIDLHTRNDSSDLAITNVFTNVISAYNIGLEPVILKDGIKFSDHASFWQNGYSAILAIEDDKTDFNPYIHSNEDRLPKIDLVYYTNFVKAALGTLAHMGCLLEGEVRGMVTDAVSHQAIPGATIAARLGGKLIVSTTSQADGSYRLFLNPGAYDLTILASDHAPVTSLNLEVLRFQPGTFDAALQPCIPVKGANFTYSPLKPKFGDTITFTSTITSGENPVSYTWDFGDGSFGYVEVVSHTYATRGLFTVKFTADNVCAAPASLTRLVFADPYLSNLPLVNNNKLP